MTEHDRDQDLVAATLASVPPPEVSPHFLARVNARIDADAVAPGQDGGWLGLADFRAWTLRLAPLAAAVALIALLWPDPAIDSTPAPAPAAATTATSFTPSSAADWQQEVPSNVLLEAALAGSPYVR